MATPAASASFLLASLLTVRLVNAQTPEPVMVRLEPGKGVTVALPNDRFSVNAKLRVQARDTIQSVAGNTSNEINVKTIRLWCTGNVLVKDLKYGVQFAFGGNDYEPGSSTPLYDAFIEYKRLRDLNIRVGQFFVPFDRLRTTKESALEMVDRTQVITELTLDRDVGLSVYSEDLFGTRGILAYNLSIFGGEGRNRFGGVTAQGGLYVLRLAVRPFGSFDDDIEGDLEREPRPRLSIGFAGAYNQNTNRQKSTYGSTLTLGTLEYGHAAADLVFKYAGFYLAAEVVYRQGLQGVIEGTKDGKPVQEWSRSGLGYVTQASMMLHRLLQVQARWSQLYTLGDTDPELVKLVAAQGHEVGGGLGIYLNGHALKFQTDYFYLFGDDPHAGRHVARMLVDASF